MMELCLNPAQQAAVFCGHEKSAIQALDRLDPALPLSPGRLEEHGFERHRHGTPSLPSLAGGATAIRYAASAASLHSLRATSVDVSGRTAIRSGSHGFSHVRRHGRDVS